MVFECLLCEQSPSLPPIGLFQHQHALPEASDPLLSLVIQGSCCCCVNITILLPLPCRLTALHAAPRGQVLGSIMGLKNSDLEPGGTNLANKTDIWADTCRSWWINALEFHFSGKITGFSFSKWGQTWCLTSVWTADFTALFSFKHLWNQWAQSFINIDLWNCLTSKRRTGFSLLGKYRVNRFIIVLKNKKRTFWHKWTLSNSTFQYQHC